MDLVDQLLLYLFMVQVIIGFEAGLEVEVRVLVEVVAGLLATESGVVGRLEVLPSEKTGVLVKDAVCLLFLRVLLQVLSLSLIERLFALFVRLLGFFSTPLLGFLLPLASLFLALEAVFLFFAFLV